MDYKQTLNLPKTDFPMKAKLVKKEPELLEKWEKLNLYGLIRHRSPPGYLDPRSSLVRRLTRNKL